MRQALIVENPKWERFTDASDKFKALSGEAILVVRGRVKEKNSSAKRSHIFKKSAEDESQYAAELRKAGKSTEEISELLKSFKPEPQATKPATDVATTKKEIMKSQATTAEELAVDLAKQGASQKEIERAVEKFSAKLKKAAATVALFLLCCCSAFAQADITGYLPTAQLTALSTNTPGGGILGLGIDKVAVFQLTCTTTNSRHISTASNIVIYLDTVLQGTTFKTNAYTLTFETATNAATQTSFARITNTIGGNLRIGNTCNANTNHVLVNGLYWRVKED